MTEPWMPGDDDLKALAHNTSLWLNCKEDGALDELKETIREAVAKALAEHQATYLRDFQGWKEQEEARHAREVERARLEAEIEMLDKIGCYRMPEHEGCDLSLVAIDEACWRCSELFNKIVALAALEGSK